MLILIFFLGLEFKVKRTGVDVKKLLEQNANHWKIKLTFYNKS